MTSKDVNESVRLQQNIYAHTVAQLYNLPGLPTMYIWQLFKGIQDPELAWMKIEVPPMDYDLLEREVRPSYEMFKASMNKVMEQGSPDAIRDMPLQGLNMFGGKKCTHYCNAKDICDGLGKPRFDVSNL